MPRPNFASAHREGRRGIEARQRHHQGAAHPGTHHGKHHLPAAGRGKASRTASSAATRSSSATWADPTLRKNWEAITMEDLAGHLYDSLHDKIMTLPDEVIVYPAHGAGSACGKNMSKETFDTLGHQKEVNYALKAASKEQFIREVTDGILPPPAYFPQNVAMNKGTIPELGSGEGERTARIGARPSGADRGKRRCIGTGHARPRRPSRTASFRAASTSA
jgi:hypothetical protein